MLSAQLLPLWKNAGPLYNSGFERLLGPCRRFYWRNLFFATNHYPYEEMVSGTHTHTHQILYYLLLLFIIRNHYFVS